MSNQFIKPLAVFIILLAVFVGIIAAVGIVGTSSSAPDGESIVGQSPQQFQPDNLQFPGDPEEGDISVSSELEGGDILIDLRHDNQISRAKLEPIETALQEAGHTVTYDTGGDTLQEQLADKEGYLIVQPTSSFADSERNTIQSFTADGGRVVVLAEPTQPAVTSQSLFGSSTSLVSFGADKLTTQYGIIVGPEVLYNADDDAMDNNFKSIYAEPTAGGSLTSGAERITFDSGGYLLSTSQSEARPLFEAAEGTKTLETRREGEYITAMRNKNVVVVADSDFIRPSELYDVDNQVFISSLLEFLLPPDANTETTVTGNESVGNTTLTETPIST
jgi:hypothetical protein